MVRETDRSLMSYPSDDTLEKECLDQYELTRGKGNDERDNMQKKTFTKWVNKHLTKAGLKVDDLFVDLRDGYALIALLEALTDERIPKEHGNTRFHRIQNVQYCLDFLKQKNVKLVNIRSEDIVEGNGKLTLGLIWTIILHFQVSVIRQRLLLESQPEMVSSRTNVSQVFDAVHKIDATSARVALLQMAQKVTADYPRVKVNNFSSAWRDGLAFNAIIHHYRPTVIDWYKISDKSVTNRERLNNAFHTAEREFGVSRLLDAEDVDTHNPDEKSIITYVSSLYNALPQQPELNKWQKVQEQYIQEAREWKEWIERAIQHVDERVFIGSTTELIYKLQNFREVDVQPRDEQKKRLCLVYDQLEKTIKTTDSFAVPRELSSSELQRAWDELMSAIEQRFEILERQRAQEGASNDIVSRLQHGIGITNKKLDLILKRIEELEKRVDSSPPTVIERTVTEIVEELNVLETLIFEEAEQLKNLDHPNTEDINRQVDSLRQRRTAYQHRLNNQILDRVKARTDKLVKIRQTSFSRIEECIDWVRVRMERLTSMEFSTDLEELEHTFQQHTLDNHDIQDFRQNVDECVVRKGDLSSEDSYEYNELLHVLESEYQQLRDLAAHRILDFESLIAFVHAAQQEHNWVWEREQIEVSRNWSEVEQLDLPKLTKYFKQLLHEMELREKQYNDVHNQGAALLNQGHPARQVIESYLKTLQSEWDWPMALSKCFEQHLRDAVDRDAFLREVADVEHYIDEQTARLESKYNSADFSLEEGEIFLRELEETKDVLENYQQVFDSLAEKCATISPLWQRGDRIARPIKATAICDYADQHVTIRTGEDVVLLDNSDLVKWRIRDSNGVDGQVQSVVIRISPPETRLSNALDRPLHKFDKLKETLDRKTRMVRFVEAARVRSEKMTAMEFSDDLDALEDMLEQQKTENRGIKEFRKEIDDFAAKKAELSPEEALEHDKLMRAFETEYQQLRDVSARRTLDLEALISFIRAAEEEHKWVLEREKVEVGRDWSDIKKLDLSKLTNYYKQLVHEMEIREKQYNAVHNQGTDLLNQGHPARRIIESYMKTLEAEWDWPMALSKCFEQHLRDAVNLQIYLEEVADADHITNELIARLENNYNRTNFTLKNGERYQRELEELDHIVEKHYDALINLKQKAESTISPLWQRRERIDQPLGATAICHYADDNLTIQTGDEVVLIDNTDPTKWVIRNPKGVEGEVQSVVIRISPGPRFATVLQKPFEKYQYLRTLKDKKNQTVGFINTIRFKSDEVKNSEFPNDVQSLEEMLEKQTIEDEELKELRKKIDDHFPKKNKSHDGSNKLDDTLLALEKEFEELRDHSAQRVHDLKALIDFVRSAQEEHNWVWEREQVEVSRNWSDVKQLDLPKLNKYYKEMLRDMENREKQYNDVHNRGVTLLNQGHPARQVIESYLKTLQSEWDWPMALSKCFEQHFRDAANSKEIQKDIDDGNHFIQEQATHLEKKFNKSKYSMEEADRAMSELLETKKALYDYKEVLEALTERSATISPMWQRGERISGPTRATALCDYADQNVTIRTGDDIALLDNSDTVKWTVRDLSGVQGPVQSVVIRIAPPDLRVNNSINHQLGQFENLKKLWEQKWRVAHFNKVMGTVKSIQEWDVDFFNTMDRDQRDELMNNLYKDACELFEECEPDDPLSTKVSDEIAIANRHFEDLRLTSSYNSLMSEILNALEENRLDEDIGKSPIDVKRVVREQKKYEDTLRGQEKNVADAKCCFNEISEPTKEQIDNHDRFLALWDDVWKSSSGYVDRMKAKMMEGLDAWVDEELARYSREKRDVGLDESDAVVRRRAGEELEDQKTRRWMQVVEVKWVEVTSDEQQREFVLQEKDRIEFSAQKRHEAMNRANIQDIRDIESFLRQFSEKAAKVLQKCPPEAEEKWMNVVEVEWKELKKDDRIVEVVNSKELVDGLKYDVEIGPSNSAGQHIKSSQTQSVTSPTKAKAKKGGRHGSTKP